MNYKKLRNIFSNTLAVQIIFIAIVVVAVFTFDRSDSEELSVFKSVSKNEAALFIDLDSMKKVFAGEVIDGMTVLDALNASVTAGQIKLTYHVDNGNNTNVTEINGHTIDGNTQFTFYVNSKKLDPSELNKTPIRSGDKITIRLE